MRLGHPCLPVIGLGGESNGDRGELAAEVMGNARMTPVREPLRGLAGGKEDRLGAWRGLASNWQGGKAAVWRSERDADGPGR